MKKVILFFSILLSVHLVNAQTIPVTDTVKVTLVGTDADGTVISYAFKQTSGTAVNIIGGTTASPTLVFSASGTYVFSGIVTDNDGGTDTESFTVAVNSANILPHVKITVNEVDYTNSTYPIKLK